MVSPNAYARYSANSDYTNPIIWSPKAEEYIYNSNPFMSYGVLDTRYLNKPGRQGNYTLETGFSSGLLTEGVPTQISALTFEQVTINFYAYGDAKQLTDEEVAEGMTLISSGIPRGAMGSMSENRASVIVTELMQTSTTGIYANGKTSANILATDTFNTDMMANAKTAFTIANNECKVIFVHPLQENSLIKLDGFTKVNELGSNRVVVRGQIGSYYGIDVIASNHITSAGEGAGSAVTVYKAIALGNRPFIFAPKRVFEFNSEYETKRSRAETHSWWEMFGTTRLRDSASMVLTSAGGY